MADIKNAKNYFLLKEVNIDTFNKKARELTDNGFLPYGKPSIYLDTLNAKIYSQCFISEEIFLKLEKLKYDSKPNF